MITRIGAVSRFVSDNEQGQSDINTVSSPHVETVVLLSKVEPGPKQVRMEFSL